MDEPRRRIAGMLSGLDIHYDLGEGHPLLGRRMPDLDLVTAEGAVRVFTLLHDARGGPAEPRRAPGLAIPPRGRTGCRRSTPNTDGEWELPVLGHVPAPAAVLIRPDGHVAWVGDGTDAGLRDALTTWFGFRDEDIANHAFGDNDGTLGSWPAMGSMQTRPSRCSGATPSTTAGSSSTSLKRSSRAICSCCRRPRRLRRSRGRASRKDAGDAAGAPRSCTRPAATRRGGRSLPRGPSRPRRCRSRPSHPRTAT